jgi:hypothetical protein
MNYYDEEVLERDMGNDNPDGLPTYDYLHEQEGANPNSRSVGFAIEMDHSKCSSTYEQIWTLEGLGREEVDTPIIYATRVEVLSWRRAAERFADITPEERQQRRTRGWGPTVCSVFLLPHKLVQ